VLVRPSDIMHPYYGVEASVIDTGIIANHYRFVLLPVTYWMDAQGGEAFLSYECFRFRLEL
jgi:hypothetical protein